MRKSSKRWIKALAWVVAIVAVLVLVRNSAIKSGARAAVQKATGFDLEVGRVHAGITSPTFEIDNLKLINPEDFPEAAAFDIRQAKVNYDLRSFFTDEVHFREVILDVPSVTVVKKEDGETNLQRLSDKGKKMQEAVGGGEKKPEAEGTAAPSKPAEGMRIDKLTIRVGTVEVHDYSQGGDRPVVSSYVLNLDQTSRNVTSLADIGVTISAAVVGNIGAKVLGDVGKELQKGDLDNLGKGLDKAAKSLGDSLGGMFGGKKKQAAGTQ